MSNNPYQPKLVFVGDHFAGRIYELTQEKTTVGRGAQNMLAVHDPSVSQAHCEILTNGAEVIVLDLGSANGTFVNGARLQRQQSQLKSGQLLRFGSVQARLELALVADDHTATEMTAVHAHGRAVRDQRRQQGSPQAVNPSMTLDDGADPGGAEHTVAFKVESTTPTPAPAPLIRPPEKRSRKLVMVMAAVLVAGVIALLWLWWGGK